MGSSRNQPCPCGSGKKHKRCCGTRAGQEAQLPEPGPVPQHVKDATDRMMAEEGYTATAARVLATRERRARRQIVRRNGWPVAERMRGGGPQESQPSVWV